MSFMSTVCEVSLVVKIAATRAAANTKAFFFRAINRHKHSKLFQRNIDNMKNVNPRAPKAKAVDFSAIERKFIEEFSDESAEDIINKSGVNRKLLPAPAVVNGSD